MQVILYFLELLVLCDFILCVESVLEGVERKECWEVRRGEYWKCEGEKECWWEKREEYWGMRGEGVLGEKRGEYWRVRGEGVLGGGEESRG